VKRGDTVTIHRYPTPGRPTKDAARITLHGVVRKSNGKTVCVEIDGAPVWVHSKNIAARPLEGCTQAGESV
jgi:hypothetical protein